MNRLYFGDNLQWLRDTKEFPDASVDLIYLDPPFNSNAAYNYASPARTSSGKRRGRPARRNSTPSVNPFAMAAREATEAHKQTEML